MDHTRGGLLAADTEGRVTCWGSDAERIFRRTAAEMLGRPWSLLFPEALRETLQQRVFDPLQEAGDLDLEADLLRGTGEEFSARLSLSLLRDARGAPAGMVAHLLDLTESRRVEPGQADPGEVARLTSEFLARVSHEIRTPLNAVVGMTQLILHTELSEEARAYADAIRLSATHLNALVNDILDFSKLEASRLRLEEVPFSLSGLLADTLRPMSSQAEDKGLELLCQIAEDVPDGVRGDPVRLRQVLANLVDNALKFTERGQVSVRLSREPGGNGDLLHFCVSDTGIGMAPETLGRIFEPFRQADSSIRRRFGGSGLGLSISSHLVALMGGRLWVESELGKGSDFHFLARLPAHPAADAFAAHDAEALRGVRVLVIEGSPTQRESLRELLSSLGMAPIAVEEPIAGIAAVERAAQEQRPFGLVILDPAMRGSVAFRARRGDDSPLLAATPQVLLSTAAATLLQPHVPSAVRLLKPVTRVELLAAVRRALRGPGPPAEAAGAPGHAARPPLAAAPLRVLVAEDNQVSAFMVARLVEFLGHHPRVVQSGQEALSALASESFDVVLMDVQMPDMDGLEATRRWRDRERGSGRHITVLALTANTMEGDEEACLEAGMDGYLAKPLQLHELEAALAQAPVEGRTRSPAPPPGARFDLERLTAQLGGDPDAVAEVIEKFLGQGPTLLARAREALAAGQAGDLAAVAHRLKGTLLWVAAQPAAEAAGALESLAGKGDLGQGQAALETLAGELHCLLEEVRSARKTPESP